MGRDEFLDNCRWLIGYTNRQREELFSDTPVSQRPASDGTESPLDRALQWEDWVNQQKELRS